MEEGKRKRMIETKRGKERVRGRERKCEMGDSDRG